MSDMSEEGNLPTKFCDPLENLILSGGEEGGGVFQIRVVTVGKGPD